MPKTYLVSIARYDQENIPKPFNTYTINGRKVDEPYALTEITDRRMAKIFGGSPDQIEWVVVPAVEIAADLLNEYADHGIFMVSTAEPTPDFRRIFSHVPAEFGTDTPSEGALREATKRQRIFYQKVVAEGDSIWNRTKDPKMISRLHRLAAQGLNQPREWSVEVENMDICESCQQLVSPLAVKCKCGAVKNWDKARSLGLVTKEQYDFATEGRVTDPVVPVKRGPGRPPKVKTEVVTA